MSALTYTFRTTQEPNGVFVYESTSMHPDVPLYRYGPMPDAETASRLIDERVAAIDELRSKLMVDLLGSGTAITKVSGDGTIERVDPAEFYPDRGKPREQR